MPPPDELHESESVKGGRSTDEVDAGSEEDRRYELLKGTPSGDTSLSRLLRWLVPVGCVLLVGLLLALTKPILLPLTLAALITFLLTPPAGWLERRGVPRVAATVLVVVAAGLVVVGIGAAVYGGLWQIGDNINDYQERIEAKLDRVRGMSEGGDSNPVNRIGDAFDEIGDSLNKAANGDDAESNDESDDEATSQPATQPGDASDIDEARAISQALRDLNRRGSAQANRDTLIIEELERILVRMNDLPGRTAAALRETLDDSNPLPTRVLPAQETPIDRLVGALLLVAGPLGTAGLVAIFVLFMLLQRDDLRDRLIKLSAGTKINLATQAIDDAGRRISRYLRAQCIVNGTYGLTVGLGLLIIGYIVAGSWYPGLILWAALCAVLRFIPYLGPWLGASFPILVSLGGFDGYTMFLCVGGFFVVLELISNNVMEPMLYGGSVGMSEFAIIIAATVWTFVWGPVGLILAVPLTTCLVVLGKHVPALSFFNVLLGDEPVLSPQSRLYQRLLAMDAEDAAEVVEDFREEHTLTETFDELLLPALAMSERDREAGNLSKERVEFIRKSMDDLVDAMSAQNEPMPSDSVDLNDPEPIGVPKKLLRQSRVAILPASDAADETAGRMLKALLERRGFSVTVVDEERLASEKVDAAREMEADVVCISAVPPRAEARARYLVKRFIDGESAVSLPPEVIVGLWTFAGDEGRALRRLSGGHGTNAGGDRGEGAGQAAASANRHGDDSPDAEDEQSDDGEAISAAPQAGGDKARGISLNLGGQRNLRMVRRLEHAAEAIRQRAEVVSARRGTPVDVD